MSAIDHYSLTSLHMPRFSFRQCGFTMVELLVVIAILSILTAVGLPAYRDAAERWRVSAAVDEMVSALNVTRNTAVSRNGNITIAKLTGSNCSTTQDWSCGWQVFWDPNGNATVDAGDEIIQIFALTDAANSGVRVMRSVNGASMSANRWGQLNGNNAVGFTISPKPTGVSSASTTTICMNSGGRIRVLKGSVTC